MATEEVKPFSSKCFAGAYPDAAFTTRAEDLPGIFPYASSIGARPRCGRFLACDDSVRNEPRAVAWREEEGVPPDRTKPASWRDLLSPEHPPDRTSNDRHGEREGNHHGLITFIHQVGRQEMGDMVQVRGNTMHLPGLFLRQQLVGGDRDLSSKND